MFRKTTLLFVLLVTVSVWIEPVQADGANAWTTIETNLRVAPQRDADIITVLDTNTPFILEARNADSTWILGHTLDGKLRGWSAVKLLRFASGFRIGNLSPSDEIMPTPIQTAAATQNSYNPTTGSLDIPVTSIPGRSTAPLNIPQVPSISAAMRSIFLKGQQMGNNSHVFSKIGDCGTDNPEFLKPFSYGNYKLSSQYSYLQTTIDWFKVSPRSTVANPFDENSVASHNGFNSSSILDPEFAPPSVCNKGEAPLDCELRLDKPAVAVIMFGTADVIVISPEQYYVFMHEIIRRTIKHGTIPILSTFPENTSLPERSRQMNNMVLTLGRQFSLPVVNLANAVALLPNHGLQQDGIHISEAPNDASAIFTDQANMQYGFTARNLLTLQVLDNVRKAVLH